MGNVFSKSTGHPECQLTAHDVPVVLLSPSCITARSTLGEAHTTQRRASVQTWLRSNCLRPSCPLDPDSRKPPYLEGHSSQVADVSIGEHLTGARRSLARVIITVPEMNDRLCQ